jgi:hypothetical protein
VSSAAWRSDDAKRRVVVDRYYRGCRRRLRRVVLMSEGVRDACRRSAGPNEFSEAFKTMMTGSMHQIGCRGLSTEGGSYPGAGAGAGLRGQKYLLAASIQIAAGRDSVDREHGSRSGQRDDASLVEKPMVGRLKTLPKSGRNKKHQRSELHSAGQGIRHCRWPASALLVKRVGV